MPKISEAGQIELKEATSSEYSTSGGDKARHETKILGLGMLTTP